jgi:hypothetical protein
MIRDQRVILDADLAALYGVATKRFNEAFKRSHDYFPIEFAFQLTASESVAINWPQTATSHSQDTDIETIKSNSSQFAMSSRKHRGATYRPWAFTEHRALMAANILRSLARPRGWVCVEQIAGKRSPPSAMTLRELIQAADHHPLPVAGALVALPVLAWLVGMIHREGEGRNAPWKYGYAVLVYFACIPGMFAAVLTAYAMFFQNENLLDANLLVYLLPIGSMAATLVVIRKRVAFDHIPGFDRLSGLMVLLACSFGLALALHKTRIFVGFFGSIEMLLLLAGGIFALLKWGAYTLFRRRDEPEQPMPKFPPPPAT